MRLASAVWMPSFSPRKPHSAQITHPGGVDPPVVSGDGTRRNGPKARSERISGWCRLGRERRELAQCREPRERLALELTHALAGQIELVTDRLERPRLPLEPEPQLENPPFPLWKRIESPPDALAPQRLLGLLKRIRCLAVGEQVAELALVVGSDRLIQRNRRVSGAERLVDVLNREAGCLGELLLRRLATELDLESARSTRQLLLALDDVHGDPDRAGVIRDCALHRLADPPGRVGRELEAAAPVELLDRAVQAERPLLDQIEEWHSQAAIALRDRDDEPQV